MKATSCLKGWTTEDTLESRYIWGTSLPGSGPAFWTVKRNVMVSFAVNAVARSAREDEALKPKRENVEYESPYPKEYAE